MCLRALNDFMPTCLGALCFYVPTCPNPLNYLPMYPRFLRAYVPTVPTLKQYLVIGFNLSLMLF